MTQTIAHSPFSPDVLIVGAGPTGMTAAVAMSRLGMRVRIVDEAAHHKQHSQAGVLWPRTQEVFAALGLLAPWQERAERLHSISFYGYGRYLGDMPADLAASRFREPLLIGQNETEQLLEEACAAAGCPVERCVRATAVTQDSASVRATLARLGQDGREVGKETVTVPWLLATDGAGSTVRSALGLPWDPRRFAGQHVYQVDATTKWQLPLEAGRAYFFLHQEGYFGCVPLPDGVHRFFISAPDSREQQVSDPSLEQMASLISRMSGYEVRLSNPRWLTGKHYQNVITDRFRVGRVLLAGDAGKAVVPLNGQGMNTGIQDIYNLAWKLALVNAGRAEDALLDSYNTERHHNAAHLVTITGNYFTHVTEPSRVQETVVRAVGPSVLGSRSVEEHYNAFASMTDISYRDVESKAVLETGRHGPVRAGDRVPDGVAVRGDSLKTALLYRDVFSIDRFTWLLFAGTQDGAIATAHQAALFDCERWGDLVRCFVVVRDASTQRHLRKGGSQDALLDFKGDLHAAYGAGKGAAVLVRPDTHAGVVADLADVTAIRNYIGSLLR